MIQKVINGFTTAWKGLTLTMRHLFASNAKGRLLPLAMIITLNSWKGTNTIQYPKQKLPVPEVGATSWMWRWMIVLYATFAPKFARLIVSILNLSKLPKLSAKLQMVPPNGLYAAKFDIDMAKCMYCGLCTIVCPTECIVMTNQYDKTVFELKDLTYQFSDMTPEDAAEKRALLDKQQAEKQAAKLAAMQKKEGGA